jgi:hypothetical protein
VGQNGWHLPLVAASSRWPLDFPEEQGHRTHQQCRRRRSLLRRRTSTVLVGDSGQYQGFAW